MEAYVFSEKGVLLEILVTWLVDKLYGQRSLDCYKDLENSFKRAIGYRVYTRVILSGRLR